MRPAHCPEAGDYCTGTHLWFRHIYVSCHKTRNTQTAIYVHLVRSTLAILGFPSLAPDGSKWLQKNPNSLKWLEMASNNLKWLEMLEMATKGLTLQQQKMQKKLPEKAPPKKKEIINLKESKSGSK